MIAETQNISKCPDEAALAKADFKKAKKVETLADECKELAEKAAEKARYVAG